MSVGHGNEYWLQCCAAGLGGKIRTGVREEKAGPCRAAGADIWREVGTFSGVWKGESVRRAIPTHSGQLLYPNPALSLRVTYKGLTSSRHRGRVPLQYSPSKEMTMITAHLILTEQQVGYLAWGHMTRTWQSRGLTRGGLQSSAVSCMVCYRLGFSLRPQLCLLLDTCWGAQAFSLKWEPLMFS